MNAPRAQASAAVESAKICPALSAVFARLASAARRVKKMWMSVPSTLHPVGQAAATTLQARSTVPVQLASAPEDQGPPAKVRVLSLGLEHHGGACCGEWRETLIGSREVLGWSLWHRSGERSIEKAGQIWLNSIFCSFFQLREHLFFSSYGGLELMTPLLSAGYEGCPPTVNA